MAASSAVVANLALSHLGVRGRITTLSTDTTAEGVACNDFYARCVSEVLRAAPWQFAKKQAAITLVETFADGTTISNEPEWKYSYRVPEDCVTPLRVLYAGNRNPNAEMEVPFALYADTDSTTYDAATTYATGAYVLSSSIWYRALRETINDTPASSPSDWVAVSRLPDLLYCDVASAVLEYTMDVTDTTRFELLFESAVALLLAYYVAPRVTVNGSAMELQQRVAATYNELIGQATANNYNTRKRDTPPISGWESIRGIGVRNY